jgi:hypothetical protein
VVFDDTFQNTWVFNDNITHCTIQSTVVESGSGAITCILYGNTSSGMYLGNMDLLIVMMLMMLIMLILEVCF